MEKRRVFVGGLSSQVSSDDLRGRFVRFGDVVGLDLKEKTHPTTGENSIFAFVDLKITEENLAKCFKLYSNTKWKGGTMRLEMAKESFLDRLKREREERDKAAGISPQQSAVKPESSTPTSEKITPKAKAKPKKEKEKPPAVTKLPRSLGKEEKVVSFLDPEEEEEIKASLLRKDAVVIEPIRGPVVIPKLPKPIDDEPKVVSFLSGEEEEWFSSPKPAGSNKKSKKETTPKTNSSGKKPLKDKSMEKKSSLTLADVNGEDAPKSAGKRKIAPEANTSQKKLSQKSAEESKTAESKKKIPPTVNPSSEKATKKKKKKKNDASDSSDDDSEDDHEGIPDFKGSSMLVKKPGNSVAGELFKGKPRMAAEPGKILLHALNGEIDKERNDKDVEEEMEVDEEPKEEGKPLSWADRLESFSSSVWDNDDADDVGIKRRDLNARSRKGSNRREAFSDSFEASKSEHELVAVPRVGRDDEKKKAKSDEVRMAKLDEMRKSLEKRKKIVESALSGGDGSSQRPNKRVKFDKDEDDEEMEIDEKENFGHREAKKASAVNQPRLFDEDDEEWEDDNQLMVREEFLGEGGSKLLALESSYGADERFKLDSRFLKDHEPATRPLKEPEKKSGQSRGMIRFDPTRLDHLAKFEAPAPDGSTRASKAEKKKEAKKKRKEEAAEQLQTKDQAEPSVSDQQNVEATEPAQPQKFYKVTGNLKELLGKGKDQATTPSFSLAALFAETANLPDVDQEKGEDDTPVYEKPTGSAVPGWLKEAHSRVEEDNYDEEEDEATASYAAKSYKQAAETDGPSVPIKFNLTAENPEFTKLMEFYKNVSYDDSEECWQKWKESQKELMTMVSRRVKQTKRATKLHSGAKRSKKHASESSERENKKRKKMYHKIKNNKKKRK